MWVEWRWRVESGKERLGEIRKSAGGGEARKGSAVCRVAVAGTAECGERKRAQCGRWEEGTVRDRGRGEGG